MPLDLTEQLTARGWDAEAATRFALLVLDHCTEHRAALSVPLLVAIESARGGGPVPEQVLATIIETRLAAPTFGVLVEDILDGLCISHTRFNETLADVRTLTSALCEIADGQPFALRGGPASTCSSEPKRSSRPS